MQERVRRVAEAYGLSEDLITRYIDLTSEIGELGKAILEATDYGHKVPRVTEAFALEAGDCLFSLLFVCNVAGIDAKAALDKAIQKYTDRWDKNAGVEACPAQKSP